MDSLHLILLDPTEPGTLEMENQIMGFLIVLLQISQAKSNTWKDMIVGLHLKTQMAVETFGVLEPLGGKQKGWFRIALAKGLHGLE